MNTKGNEASSTPTTLMTLVRVTTRTTVLLILAKNTARAQGKVYESPRIVLDRHFEDFTGKRYKAYRGKATIEHEGWGRKGAWQQEGDCIVLFFPDKWSAPETDEQE